MDPAVAEAAPPSPTTAKAAAVSEDVPEVEPEVSPSKPASEEAAPEAAEAAEAPEEAEAAEEPEAPEEAEAMEVEGQEPEQAPEQKAEEQEQAPEDLDAARAELAKPAPKKPQSGFMLFSNATRAAVKAEDPSLTVGGVAKALGARWKAMSDEDKAPFLAEQRELKEAHAAAVARREALKALLPEEERAGAAAGAGAAGVGEEPLTSTVLPLARVKRVIKEVPEVKNVSKEAQLVLTRATELFVQRLAQDAFHVASGEGRKGVQEVHLQRVVHAAGGGQFDFLQADFERPAPAKGAGSRASAAAKKPKKKAAEPVQGKGSILSFFQSPAKK